jgi:hypothetical protein
MWYGQQKAYSKPMCIEKCSAGSTKRSCSAHYAAQLHPLQAAAAAVQAAPTAAAPTSMPSSCILYMLQQQQQCRPIQQQLSHPERLSCCTALASRHNVAKKVLLA